MITRPLFPLSGFSAVVNAAALWGMGWGSAEPEIKGQDEENNYGGYEKECAQVLV